MKISQAQTIVSKSYDHFVKVMAGELNEKLVVPFLESSPGLGKTETTFNLAREKGIGFKVMSLAQYDAGELGGWKVPTKAGDEMISLRPEWMPSEGKGILFLDELPNAPVSNQNIAAQLVNERRIGDHILGDGWFILGAGNKSSDKAGTNSMPTHLADRLMFLGIEANLEDVIGHFFAKGVDHRISGYLRFRPEFLHQFDRNAQACPSPRSWEFVASVLGWNLDPICQTEAIAGQVGRAAAADFLGYLKICDVVPNIDDLIANPDEAEIATDAGVNFAICAALAFKMDSKNAGNIIRYLVRLPRQDLAAFVIKDAISRTKKLSRNKEVQNWALTHGKDLVI